MKKIKTFAAALLAVGFLFPIFACAPEHSESDSSADSSLNTPLPPTLEENSSSSATEISPPSSTPEAPSKPETHPSKPQPVIQKAQYIRCTADKVNIRAGAGTDHAVLGSAEKGTMYAVTGKVGNWYKTYYKNKTAYIYAEYAAVFTLEKEDEKTEAVLEEGYKLVGVPYVYGAVRLHDGKGNLLKGFTAQKFDCSSLVQYVFYKGNKTLLNMNTRTQFGQGMYVSKANLRRGDCIYFTNEERQYKTGIERVGHVAIYLGDDYILHTSSDYARIEKISAKRWSFYIEARRFI